MLLTIFWNLGALKNLYNLGILGQSLFDCAWSTALPIKHQLTRLMCGLWIKMLKMKNINGWRNLHSVLNLVYLIILLYTSEASVRRRVSLFWHHTITPLMMFMLSFTTTTLIALEKLRSKASMKSSVIFRQEFSFQIT